MNLVSLSGNITKDAKIFNVKNTKKLLDTIAVDRENTTDYIDIEAWANTPKSLSYLISKLTKGNSLEVVGEFNRRHFLNKTGQRVTKTDVRLSDTLQLKSNNFGMNTALITGNLVADAHIYPHNRATKIAFTIASDDNNFTSYIPIEYWTNNSNIIHFCKKNAKKGDYAEVVNGHYYVDKFKDKYGVYQDYSDIASSNVEFGIINKHHQKQAKYNYSYSNNYPKSSASFSSHSSASKSSNNFYNDDAFGSFSSNSNYKSKSNAFPDVKNPFNRKKIKLSDDDLPF